MPRCNRHWRLHGLGLGLRKRGASSTGDFGVVVWGTDDFTSYGYAAGGGLEAINGVVLDPQG